MGKAAHPSHKRIRLCLGALLSSAASTTAKAQDTTGVLTSTSNFLDSGLATIGSIAAWGNTLARGRLDFEMGLRDLVCGEVQMTLVDEWSEARYTSSADIFWHFNVVHVGESAYAASEELVKWLITRNGSGALQISGKWLRVELSAADALDCNVSDSHLCHCLCLPKETYQLMGLLPGADQRLCRDLTDTHFVLLCSDCSESGCHPTLSHTVLPFGATPTCALADEVLQKLQHQRQRFNVSTYWISLADVLPGNFQQHLGPAENFVILSDGLSRGAVKEMGLNSIPTADETARQALPTVCATLQDKQRSSVGLQMFEWNRHPVRYPVLLIVEAIVQWMLVLFLHLDGFSSALASRRLMVSLISDSSSTRAPLEALIPQARLGWDTEAGFSFGYSIPWWYFWRARFIAYLPSFVNLMSMAGWCVLVVKQVDFAFYSNAYTAPIATWTGIYALLTTTFSLLITLLGTTRTDPQWIPLRRLRFVGAFIQSLVIAFLLLHLLTRSVLSSRRLVYPILLLGAAFQWLVGAAHIGSHAGSLYSYSWRHSLLYSCSFLQLSSLTSIGGSWK